MEVIAVLGGLVLVLLLAWRAFTGLGGRARGRMRSSPGGAGLLATLALVGVTPAAAAGDQQVVSVLALGLGAMAAVATVAAPLHAMADWGYSVIGAIASLPAMADLVSGPTCPGADVTVGSRVLVIVLLIIAAATAFGSMLLFRRWGPMAALGWFGVVEILAFLQAPGGLALPLHGAGAALAALAVAAALGALSAYRPSLVITTATVAIALANLGLDGAGLSCTGRPGLAGSVATVFVLYLAAFLGLRAFFRFLRR